jgi:hypothetical protein
MKNKNDIMFYLSVDYNEGKINTYNGVVITKTENDIRKEIIKINTGNIEKDEEVAMYAISDLFGEVDIYYMSSYDNYLMDVQYETDPEFRKDVDEENRILEEKIENYKRELGKDELSIEEFNYIVNLKN